MISCDKIEDAYGTGVRKGPRCSQQREKDAGRGIVEDSGSGFFM